MTHEKLQKELIKAAPHTTLNWEMHLKRRRRKLIIIAVIILLLFGLWSYFRAKRLKAEAALIHVVVSAESIQKGNELKESDLSINTFAASQLPDSYVTEVEDIVGMYAVQEIPGNSIITDAHIKKIVHSDSLALKLENGQVAFTINGNWLESTLPKLTIGDTVSVLVSNPDASIEDTVYIIKQAEVIDVNRDIKSASSSFVTLEITEEDSRNLLYAKSHKLLFSIALTQ